LLDDRPNQRHQVSEAVDIPLLLGGEGRLRLERAQGGEEGIADDANLPARRRHFVSDPSLGGQVAFAPFRLRCVMPTRCLDRDVRRR
jgi:hypothetical protein